eukprot:jgi/Ulvmu1/1867/UM012_0023.1
MSLAVAACTKPSSMPSAARATMIPGRVGRKLRSGKCCAQADVKRPAVVKSDSDETASVPDALPSKYRNSSGREDDVLASGPDDNTSKVPEASSNQFSGSLKGILLLNLGALLFGSNQVVIKTSEELLSPFALDALRFGAAALCFLPLLPKALKQREILLPSLELGAWLTAGYTCQAIGLSMTSASHGAFTGTFTVVAVPLLVGLSGRKIANRTWFSAAAAMLGVSLLTTAEGAPNLGDAVCVASAILFGVHKWRSECITTGVPDTTALVTLQLTVLALASVVLAVPEFSQNVAAAGLAPTLAQAPSLPWLDILFMGIGTTALTLWIEMDALKEVSAPLAALIYTAEPLWGAGFAWVLLNERWGAQGWVGAAIIVLASLRAQLGGDVAEHAPAADAPYSDVVPHKRHGADAVSAVRGAKEDA